MDDVTCYYHSSYSFNPDQPDNNTTPQLSLLGNNISTLNNTVVSPYISNVADVTFNSDQPDDTTCSQLSQLGNNSSTFNNTVVTPCVNEIKNPEDVKFYKKRIQRSSDKIAAVIKSELKKCQKTSIKML